MRLSQKRDFVTVQQKDAPWGASRGFKDRSLNPEHFTPLTIQSDVRVLLRRAMKALKADAWLNFDDGLILLFTDYRFTIRV